MHPYHQQWAPAPAPAAAPPPPPPHVPQMPLNDPNRPPNDEVTSKAHGDFVFILCGNLMLLCLLERKARYLQIFDSLDFRCVRFSSLVCRRTWRRENSRTFLGGYRVTKHLRSTSKANTPWGLLFFPLLSSPLLPRMPFRQLLVFLIQFPFIFFFFLFYPPYWVHGGAVGHGFWCGV